MLFRNITLYCSNINYPQYNSPKSFSLLPSGFFAIEKVGNTIIFYGGGWGHGVGMSQYGARELGKYLSYDAILKFYYTDIELTNVDKYSQETRIEDYEVIKQLIENYLS
jgi:peptidoglycan hydrolase-like amidase